MRAPGSSTMVQSAHPRRAEKGKATAQLKAFGADCVLALWDAPQLDPNARLGATIEDTPVAPPYSRLTVTTGWGGQRSIAVVRWPAPGTGTLAFRDPAGT